MKSCKSIACLLIALLLACAPASAVEWEIEQWPDDEQAALAGALDMEEEAPRDEAGDDEAEEARADILLVNATHPLPEGYEPLELINLYDQPDRYFAVNSTDTMLCREVFDAMQEMFKAARKDGLRGYRVTSGYRTAKKQKQLYKKSPKGIAQKAGYSEHQTGLAFDVSVKSGNFGSTKQFKWLKKHCWEYGFILRYPKGKEKITGISYEPWHYRYVGVEIAREIHELDVTLEEYLGE